MRLGKQELNKDIGKKIKNYVNKKGLRLSQKVHERCVHSRPRQCSARVSSKLCVQLSSQRRKREGKKSNNLKAL